ncbi:MAG: NADH-quinone oxidoreductase subunit L [Chloroflexi bacterium]|nr:NADH-quinone oxidoreductase subunit L [Chloroflexota bacterium]
MNESVLQTLTWLIPVGPLAAFALILLVTYRSQRLSFLTAWAGIAVALVLSWTVAFNVVGLYFEDLHHLEEHPAVVQSSIQWLPIGDYYAEPLGAAFAHAEDHAADDHAIEEEHKEEEADHKALTATTGYTGPWFSMGVFVDPLTAVMLFMVPFAVFMIFVYSVGYHNYGLPRGTQLGVPNHGQEEPMFSSFFAMMSLFAGAMLTLVVADNLLLLFVGWEVMGFCSYSLIGFWYARDYDNESLQKLPPRKASVKAFMTTRIADVVMLMGIVFFYRTFGTLNFTQAFTAESIMAAADSLALGTVGLGLMALMIFTGTVGKSAQWPFHVWLPNAMEGPTPVSAVIHAAAMVSAGIFLILRIFPLIAVGIEASMTIGLIIAGIGAFTALMAATIAVAQNDVKGVLAYSTISQLGFMVAAIGLGAYVAAAFHLITHAFFKALLFLGSGSVIHGMEHGAEHVHDHHTDPQDMLKMGGLREKMPITYWTFLIGGMALSGFPFVTAGFWSKDEIFADAFYQASHDNPLGWMVLVMLALAALLTAFYTTRQICLTFLGKPRSPLAEHAHESNGYMTTPLILLSFFAIAAGWLGIPDNFLGGDWGHLNFFHHFVGATLYVPLGDLADAEVIAHGIFTLPWSWIPPHSVPEVAGLGIFAGWLVYGRKPLTAGQADPMIAFLGKPLHSFLENKWYWDEAYDRIFVRPTLYFSEVIVYEVIDKGIIDATLHFVANTVYAIGRGVLWFEQAVFSDGVDWLKDKFLEFANEFRTFQSGKVQEYALLSMLIVFVFATFLLLVNAFGVAG